MTTDADQTTSPNSTTKQEEADRKARAKLADPDVGSPEEGETTTDDKPGT